MREYSRTWKKPQIYKDIELAEENIDFKEKDIITNLFTPRGAQIEALVSFILLKMVFKYEIIFA